MIHHYHITLHLLVVVMVLMWVPYSGRAQVGINIDNNMDVGSMHHLYPFDTNTFPKPQDLADDVSVQRVVTILHGNIKQWSFIESQLLEPNVNLGMPEIFIPLRHLTTTLEVLGKILFMKNDLIEAKACLERACPLMELLPPQPNEDQNHYASACFNLLREVYNNFYGPDGKGPISKDKDNDSNQAIDIDMEVDIALEGAPHNLEDFDFDQDNEDDDYNSSNSGRRRSRFNSGENYGIDRDKHKPDNNDNTEPFDVEIRLEQLRSPYEHLRAELHDKEIQNIKPNQKLLGEPSVTQPSSSTTKREQYEPKIPSTRHSIPNHFQNPRRKPLKLTDPDELIFPAYMYESSYDGRLLRLKTKFDNVLRRFVLEASKDSRQVVMKQAEDFLEEFYISIEDASVEAGHDLKEFNEIMDLGNAFLEMLSKATIDYEFSFILEDIRTIGLDAEYMLNGDETVEHTSHLHSFDRSRAIVLKAVGRALHYMILPNETSNFDQYSNGLHFPAYGHDTEASAALFDKTTSAIPSANRSAVPTLRGDMKIATNIMLFFIVAIICLIATNQYQASTQRRKVRSRSKSHNKTLLDSVQSLFLKQAVRDSDDEDNVPSKNIRKASTVKGSEKGNGNQYGPKSVVDHAVGLANILISSIKVGNNNDKTLKQRKEASKAAKTKKAKSTDKPSTNSAKTTSTSKQADSKSPSEVIDHVKSLSSDESNESSQGSDDINMSTDGYDALYEDDEVVVKPLPDVKPEIKSEAAKPPVPKKVEFLTEPKATVPKALPVQVSLKPALKQTTKPLAPPSIPASSVNVPKNTLSSNGSSSNGSSSNSSSSNGSSSNGSSSNSSSSNSSSSNSSSSNSSSSNASSIGSVSSSNDEKTNQDKPSITMPESGPVNAIKAPLVDENKIVAPVEAAPLLPTVKQVHLEAPILGLNVENDTVVNTQYEVFSKHDNFSILQPATKANLPIASEDDEEDNLLYLSTQLSTGDMINKPYEGLGGFWGGLFAPAPASSIPADSGPGRFERRSGLGNPSTVGGRIDLPMSGPSSYMSSFDQNYQVPFMSPQMSAYSDPMRMDYQQNRAGHYANEPVAGPPAPGPPLSAGLSFGLMTDLSPNAPSFSPFTGLSNNHGLTTGKNLDLDPLLHTHGTMGLNLNGLKSNLDHSHSGISSRNGLGLAAPPGLGGDFPSSEKSRLNFASSRDEQDKY